MACKAKPTRVVVKQMAPLVVKQSATVRSGDMHKDTAERRAYLRAYMREYRLAKRARAR
jgi:hypothetical protein